MMIEPATARSEIADGNFALHPFLEEMIA